MRGNVWSATRIDIANYCRMRYYLIYGEKEKSLNLSAYEKGSLLHKLIEDFWVLNEEKIKVPRYSDAEEFGKKAQGKWMQRIIAAEKSGRNIDWRYDDEKWVIRNTLPKICIPLYKKLVEEGPPLYSELGFWFSLKDKFGIKFFRGRIDEVRIKEEDREKKVILRDYKSGNPWIGNMKVEHDPQMTLYNVGLCSLCHEDRTVAKALELEEEAKKFMQEGYFISDKIHPEFFMLEALNVDENAKNKPEVIHKTSRKSEHFLELLNMINGTIESVRTGNIYPERGRKCDSCDVKDSCAKRLSLAGNKNSADINGQLVFSYAAPLYIKPLEDISAREKNPQRRFKWKK